MKFLVDHADIQKIKEVYRVFPMDGVSTNPSILAASGRQPFDVLKEIREFIGTKADLHVQVVGRTADAMMEDAERIRKELGASTYVKIPVNEEGLVAIKTLRKEDKGVRITATAVYTAMQGFLAAKAGANFVAPYVNRIDNLGANGIETAKIIHDIFRRNDLSADILAASFKNSQQVLELCAYGVGAATVAPDVIHGLIKNDCVNMAIEAFTKDFAKLCGEGVTMKNAK